jgi:peptidoglycan hydrolase CwlO-like protein
MLKNTIKNQSKLSIKRLQSLALIAMAVGIAASVPIATADTYDNQINALRAQNDSTQSALGGLQSEAASFQDAIAQLNAQISQLQSLLDANTAKQAQTVKDIADAQALITLKKSQLGADVQAMYVDGTVTTIEELAGSSDLSAYIDKQEYRTAVQNQLNAKISEITALEAKLQKDKIDLDVLIKTQADQQSQLASSKAQQASLLSYNEAQQGQFVSQLNANNANIKALQAQQRAAYLASIGTGGRSSANSSIRFKNYSAQDCGGNYRYCDYGLDQYVADPWGFNYARECVHYVLSSLANDGKYIPRFPGGGGNAYQWVPYTTSVGAATLVSDPQPGDVVYMPVGSLGHVGMVEYVNDDGTVHVSQMNYSRGIYSTMDLYVTSGVQFLRFHH